MDRKLRKKIAINNNLGKDISDLFQVGRNGIDEAKTSEWGSFNYPKSSRRLISLSMEKEMN